MIESLFFPLLMLAAQPASDGARPAEQSPGAPPAEARLTSENRAALRCSAAFALVGARQEQGGATSQSPDIKARGREFFVVAMAGLMDEHGLDREAIERIVRSEAEALSKSGEVDKVMPACLLMLRAAGL